MKILIYLLLKFTLYILHSLVIIILFDFLSLCFSKIVKNSQGKHYSFPNDWNPKKYESALQTMSSCVNSFGSSLFNTLIKDSGNVIFSPLAIHKGLMAIASGTTNETRDIFKNVLRLHEIPENISV